MIPSIIAEHSPDIVLFQTTERGLGDKNIDLDKYERNFQMLSMSEVISLNGHEIVHNSRKQKNLNIVSMNGDSVVFEIRGIEAPRIFFDKFELSFDRATIVSIEFYSPQRSNAKLYYLNNESKTFSKKYAMKKFVKEGWNTLEFNICDEGLTGWFRFDPCKKEGIYIIKSFRIFQ